MHIHQMSPTVSPNRNQQTAAAKTPTFSLSDTTATGSATATGTTGTLASSMPATSTATASAPANPATPFASMASNLQSILLGASQSAGGATSLASQAAGAYGLTGSLLG